MNLVLIVEDDAWTRHALSRIFRHQGWKVKTASTVAEGLDLVGLKPECVILDLSLPDGSGAAILRKIRDEGLSSRVVLCTVLSDAEKLGSIESLKPDAIVTKPVEVDDLIDACCG